VLARGEARPRRTAAGQQRLGLLRRVDRRAVRAAARRAQILRLVPSLPRGARAPRRRDLGPWPVGPSLLRVARGARSSAALRRPPPALRARGERARRAREPP